MLPHLFGMYARAAMRYWAFVGQLLDDFAMLLFSLGIFGVVHASWLEFSAQSSHAEVEHVEL